MNNTNRTSLTGAISTKLRAIAAAVLTGTALSPVSAATPAAADSTSSIVSHLGFDMCGAYVGSSTSALRDAGYYGDDQKELRSAMSAHLKYSFSYSHSTRTGRLYEDIP